jgi:hypothetical protein|tara:strand:+ start:203 stop:547 length:345 start_codon:yes stop_codon:yes gene_type:complete
MQLMTKQIEKKAAKYPIYSQDEKGLDAEIIVKFFDPTSNWTWYATEYDPINKIFMGYVSGFENEFGSFSLTELQSIKGRLGLGIERDRYFENKKVKDIPIYHLPSYLTKELQSA